MEAPPRLNLPHAADADLRSAPRRALLLAAAGLAAMPAAGQAVRSLRHLSPPPNDRFGRYVVQLLDDTLERAKLGCQLQPVPPQRLIQGRIELEMAKADGAVDLMWGMASRLRDKQVVPVPVPLERGLSGWRVLVVRRSDLSLWPRLLPLDTLRSRAAGQGLHWPDVAILRSNRFRVETGLDSSTLFTMLRKGRIDYFPRSVLEVSDEMARLDADDLAVVPELLLRYPAVSYVYLGNGARALAKPLTDALRQQLAEGRLSRLFDDMFGEQLAALHLPQRRAIALVNPLAPPGLTLVG